MHAVYNPVEQMYEVYETGIIYAVSFALMDSLKKSYTNVESVKLWYTQLDRQNKQLVLRLGLPNEDMAYNDGNFIE